MQQTLFLRRLEEVLGPLAAAAIACMGADRRVGLWGNPLRGEPEESLASISQQVPGVERTPWHAQAATAPPESRTAITHSPLVDCGAVYVQSLSSMLAPLALGVQPGEEVLDLCAAPGGKTLHLAAALRGEGYLAAVEAVRGRFFKLKDNLARCGAEGLVRLFQADGRDVGRKTPGRFDAVLLDAPCSSETRVDLRQSDALGYWSEKKIAESARKQKALLRSAIDATRPGGRVLYCTCTFAPEENELVVAHVLRRLKGKVGLEPIALPIANQAPGLTHWRGKELPAELAHTARVLPTDKMTGFFLALLRVID
ncbi:Ribosomal RNA small subunit methyltransferase F [Pirellulimonas nuda]|uniref:Ribosomal RNA small subunit methyltransferase F n=1 Tax=Pirellulimonas nuda TaxID=2528009 RepID=A0A518DEN2_9BACT|nr:RsmB/NOP family class I SAM-dependent RNA methyltransferase [Pirellulimonas nuda]QDU89941.1 Ribosomal RNA small subunit methyltransferase F [Pirellulimonas nuda]